MVEARSGGICVVRMVMSGSGTGAARVAHHPTASIQLILDAERAGRALLTLAEDDLDQHVAVLVGRELSPGTVANITCGSVVD